MANVKNKDNAYHILLSLLEGEKRFSELTHEVKKASLAKELNELQNLKYVERIVDDKAKPPMTFYRITKTGKSFLCLHKEERMTKLKLELKRLNILD